MVQQVGSTLAVQTISRVAGTTSETAGLTKILLGTRIDDEGLSLIAHLVHRCVDLVVAHPVVETNFIDGLSTTLWRMKALLVNHLNDGLNPSWIMANHPIVGLSTSILLRTQVIAPRNRLVQIVRMEVTMTANGNTLMAGKMMTKPLHYRNRMTNRHRREHQASRSQYPRMALRIPGRTNCILLYASLYISYTHRCMAELSRK